MNTDATIDQALSLIQQGKPKQAERLLKGLVRQQQADALFLLGLIRYQEHRFQDSITLYEQALEQQEGEAEYLAHLGLAQFQAGFTGQGLNTLKNTIEAQPKHINSHLFLAQCLLKINMTVEALGLFNEVLQFDQYHFQAWLGKIHALIRLGQLDQAIQQLDKIGPFMQDRPELYIAYARLFMEQGRLEAAVEAGEAAARLAPDNDEALRVLGQAMDQWGKKTEAMKYYRRILRHNPYDLYVIYRLMRMGAREIPQLAHRLRHVLNHNPDLAPQLKKSILFNLGSAEESMGRHRKAMELFLQAGQYHHQNPEHDKTEQLFSALRTVFSRERIDALGTSSRCEAEPVFIVGLPRSGSTLLESMLAMNPRIRVIGESPLLPQVSIYGGKLLQPEEEYPLWVEHFPEENWTGLAEYYLHKTYQGSTQAETRIVDKNLGNLIHVGLIRLLFPRARIIHCRRNPLDVATSCLSIDFAGHFPWTYTMEDFIRYHAMYEKLMSYWTDTLPGFIMDLQYEDMVSRPKETSQAVFKFLGLEWNEEVLAFSGQKRRVATASVNQVREGIYTSSRQRWKRYGDLIQPLLDAFPEWATD